MIKENQPLSGELGFDPNLVREIHLQAQGEGPFLDTLEHSEGSGEDWLNQRTRAVFLEQGIRATRHYVETITDQGIFLLSLLKPTDLGELNYAREKADSAKPCADMVYGIATLNPDHPLGWTIREFYSKQDITDDVVAAGDLPRAGDLETLPSLVLCTNFIFSKTPSSGSNTLADLFEKSELQDTGTLSCVAIVPKVDPVTLSLTFHLEPVAVGSIATSVPEPVYFQKYISPLSPLGLPAVITVGDAESLYSGEVSPALYESVGFFLSRAVKALSRAKSDLAGGIEVDLREAVLNSVGLSSEPPVKAFSLVH